jgi:hypothetical protein
VSAMPQHGLGQPPVACWVGRVAWVADCSTTNPLGRVQVASKATTGHSAWARTSSAGQGPAAATPPSPTGYGRDRRTGAAAVMG